MEHTHRCTRCGRILTALTSIARGMGDTCTRRARQEAAVADVTPTTVAKAVEDINDGAIIDTRCVTSSGRQIYAVVSSTGARHYLATAGGACTCKAGLRGRHLCRHAAAARMVAAASKGA